MKSKGFIIIAHFFITPFKTIVMGVLSNKAKKINSY